MSCLFRDAHHLDSSSTQLTAIWQLLLEIFDTEGLPPSFLQLRAKFLLSWHTPPPGIRIAYQRGLADMGRRPGDIQLEIMREKPVLQCNYHPLDLTHPPLVFPGVTRFNGVVLIDASLQATL
ncbi:hypothetical protein JWG39_03670 [Desulforhopalus vacuolatus]|uniref:hypothetical protein n=1 Tax=Desulforhopalus vacuolatus TaxID=40414 RepID=UPI00196530BF|nr:hypothetical protein [Desulforhopalus vacuolatus]MBM9518912.1 hypothetical protein [Desulforhopalus vacuolatus]